MMRTEYFFFVHHTTIILGKLSNWCFEHSGNISCSLLINRATLMSPANDETHVCGYIYIYIYIFIYICMCVCVYVCVCVCVYVCVRSF